jgi:phosphatidylserine/phosphatidylglycerophosphate/cardiolipin synthase-like enzyme
MRAQRTEGGLHVQAIAGSHVIVFGFDWPQARAGQLQGFAIHRTDHSTGRADWLEAQKRYASTDPGLDKGTRVSTRNHPLQTFQWADYTVSPGVDYTYRIVALGGTPAALTALEEAVLSVRTITRTASGHAIHFNRGAIAAQEYARRFANRAPEDVPNGQAFDWLSRGLFESLIAFIAQAQAGDALHAAIYEARHAPVLDALRAARERGVDVRIIYDAKENGDDDSPSFPREENIGELDMAHLTDIAIAREKNPSYIAHNKFIVLSRQGAPEAVWGGSLNWSQNGFFGQLNTGHEVWNGAVAQQFADYWQLLAADPASVGLRESITTAFPLPAPWPDGCTPIFSPRKDRDALDRYIDEIPAADAVLLTLAFSIDDKLGQALTPEHRGLRYVLMDGLKGNKKQVDKLSRTVKDIRATESGRVAMGAYLRTNALDQFLLERSNAMAQHVQFIHTKFMLIDPLGARPLVISGSANFSLASSKQNDENMLVIAGDQEVADIYLGEFMRSYTHYAFRDAVRAAMANGTFFTGNPLNEDCSWAKDYYGTGFRSRQRTYFSRSAVQ